MRWAFFGRSRTFRGWGSCEKMAVRTSDFTTAKRREMKTMWMLVPLALIAGVALPIQFAANARLSGAAGGPVTAAAISFFIGTATLLMIVGGIFLVGRGES